MRPSEKDSLHFLKVGMRLFLCPPISGIPLGFDPRFLFCLINLTAIANQPLAVYPIRGMKAKEEGITGAMSMAYYAEKPIGYKINILYLLAEVLRTLPLFWRGSLETNHQWRRPGNPEKPKP